MTFTGVALLLFLFYDNSFSQDVNPSQACLNAQMELTANQACFQAVVQVGQGTGISGSVLEEYCSPTCRDLITRVENECVS